MLNVNKSVNYSELISRSGPLWNMVDRLGMSLHFSDQSSKDISALCIFSGIILLIDLEVRLRKMGNFMQEVIVT